jgi:dihydrofolate reductase
MSRIIVIEFVSLDGVIQDPDGAEGSAQGGWAFRHGPQAVAGDKFGLGELLDTGALLLGRRTWQKFSAIWPTRDDDFSTRMNAIPKLVASRTLDDVSAWGNSTVLEGDLVAQAAARKADRDLIVAGSASVAHALMDADLVDEFRLLVFPTVVGEGARLFELGRACTDLSLASVQAAGPAALLVYSRGA